MPKFNPTNIIGLEAIDYQDSSYFDLLTSYIREYQNKKIDKRDFEKKVSDSIKTRFNFSVKFKVDKSSEVNAWMIPHALDEKDMLSYRRFGSSNYFLEMIKQETVRVNQKLMSKIAKGDLSDTGLLDYKNARVSGLFAELPPADSVCLQGTFDKLEAEEVAAIILHEIGHYWTWLEFLGVYTCRNAIITGTVNTFLKAKTEQEKVQIILAANNAYGITMDESKVSKLNDENATKILVGTMNSHFKDSVGYVQYDDNTSEVIADQFSVRMGSGLWKAKALDKLYRASYGFKPGTAMGEGELFKKSFRYSLLALAVSAAAVAIGLALPASLSYVVTQIGLLISLFTIRGIIGFTFGDAATKNGTAYDRMKDRVSRVYREQINYIKTLKDAEPETIKELLKGAESSKEILKHLTVTEDFVVAKLLRFFSSSYRQQEKNKLYQQLVEELLANELYLTGNKFKTIGVE